MTGWIDCTRIDSAYEEQVARHHTRKMRHRRLRLTDPRRGSLGEPIRGYGPWIYGPAPDNPKRKGENDEPE